MNVFQKLELRRSGACGAYGATSRFSAAQFHCLRLKRRWRLAEFGKDFVGSRQISKLLLLTPDAVCVLLQYDAEVWQFGQWRMSLRRSSHEKICDVLYLRRSKAVLLYTQMDGEVSTHRVLILDVEALLRGHPEFRDGALTETQSSDLVHDERNACLWMVEDSQISCWDDETLQPCFHIRKEPDLRALRIGLGSLAQVQGSDHVSVAFFDKDLGCRGGGKVLLPGSRSSEAQVVEMVTRALLLCKREHSAAVLLDVTTRQILCSLPETEDWIPERTESFPKLSAFLALLHDRLELWHYLRSGTGGLCWCSRKIDADSTCVVLDVALSWVLFPSLEKERGGGYNQDLNLWDLSFPSKPLENPGRIVGNVCHRRCSGGGVWKMAADLSAGVVLVLGQQGDLSCHAPDLGCAAP